MSNGNCNLCLAQNKRAINIRNTHLQTLYEKLANFKVSPEISLWMCCVCHTRLKQCHQLSMLAKQTRCFLTSGLLQTNIKLKSRSMGLVNLSRSITSHIVVPSPNSNSIIQVPVKKEHFTSLKALAFDKEDLEHYVDMVNTDDNWHSDDSKEKFGDDAARADIKVASCIEKKVEIEINTHSGTNDVTIKEEIEDKIKKEVMEDDLTYDPADAPESVLYTCNICSNMFNTMSSLIKHKRTHNTGKLKLNDKSYTGKKVVCPICGKYYSDRRVLTRHQKIHSAVRPFSCEICNKTFSRRDHYNKHAQTHPGFHLYTCPDCSAHFPNGAQLKAHECTPREDENDLRDALGPPHLPEITIEKVGRGDMPEGRGDSKDFKAPVDGTDTKRSKKTKKKYSCDTCNKHFAKPYQLETHKLLQHKGVRYECDHCGKAFLRRASLCLHLRTHSGEQRYCCDACGKTFTYKSSLNVHRRVHTGARPYACELCARRFAAFGQLAEHRLVHSDVRAFACELCGKGFKRRRHLKKHMMSHTGEKPYTCDVCLKSFARNDNYVIHRRIHTGEKPFACDVCGSTFSENRHLKKHRVVHE